VRASSSDFAAKVKGLNSRGSGRVRLRRAYCAWGKLEEGRLKDWTRRLKWDVNDRGEFTKHSADFMHPVRVQAFTHAAFKFLKR